MDESMKLIVSFLLGVFATVLGAVLSDRLTTRRELYFFYSRVQSLLYRLIELNQISSTRDDISAQSLHYTCSKLWYLIPEKEDAIRIRSAIFDFIKGGNQLEKIKTEKRMLDLYQWLKLQETKNRQHFGFATKQHSIVRSRCERRWQHWIA